MIINIGYLSSSVVTTRRIVVRETADRTTDAPGCRRIVITGFVGRSETLWALNVDGSNLKQIIPENRISNNLSLSDDGRVLIFDSNRLGSTEIWRADGDGANLRQLTTGGRNSQPHVSPDGKFVVYRSSREGIGELWRISTEGGEPVRITEKSAEWARFSPNGK